jgi:oxygen-independent coproporphyrinogen-3 oxidase
MSARPVIPLVPQERAAAQPASRSATGISLSSLPPLSLYVHVPWCVRKCPYCDFNSHELGTDLPERRYLDALQADLQQALPDIWGRSVISVFIGGGTPSLLSAAAVDEMLAMFRSHLNLLPDAEITLEANPGTAEAGRFSAYAASGVNRLSLGVQSFNDQALKALGRIHDADQAMRAIEMAHQAFSRINLDVMFALPDQTVQGCLDDVERALSFDTEHLSFYNLTLEPNTVFAKYPPAVPDDDTAALMQEEVAGRLEAAGFQRYEVSAFARPGARCLHNLNYWTFGDYLGIGPGAHGKLSFHDGIVRHAKLKNPQRWMDTALALNGTHLAQSGPVEKTDLPFEFMLNALRLKDGVSAAWFAERTGLPLSALNPVIDKLVRQGLFDTDPTRLRVTETGWRYLNTVLTEFLP